MNLFKKDQLNLKQFSLDQNQKKYSILDYNFKLFFLIIAPAGNADDRRFGVGVLQPLGQTVGLHLQDQFAALGAALGVAGHEGCRVDPAGEGGLGEFQIELHRGVTVAASCFWRAKK